jgi:hypothetical protein
MTFIPIQLPVRWVPGVNRPVCENDHSPPSSTECTNAWNYASTPEHAIMGRCLIKYKDLFLLHDYSWQWSLNATVSTSRHCSPQNVTTLPAEGGNHDPNLKFPIQNTLNYECPTFLFTLKLSVVIFLCVIQVTPYASKGPDHLLTCV